MRLRGRDLEDSTGSWIPSILRVQTVRLRLRLDRRTDSGRSLWQLVDLSGETSGRGLWDRTPPTCSQSKTSRSLVNFQDFLVAAVQYFML
ncbi:sex comb on midleg-like protein 4 isoform X1 [Tachysurus ichikawai]